MPSIDEKVTEQFLRWSYRGQGMELWDTPVSPEPAFVPFRGYDYSPVVAVDDGRRPTLVSSFVRRMFSSTPSRPEVEEEVVREPRELVRESITELFIFTPKDQKFKREDWAYFLTSIAGSKKPISFEFLASRGKVSLLLAVESSDVPRVKEHIAGFFPQCVAMEKEYALRTAWEEASGECFAVVSFALSEAFMQPLKALKLDPFVGLISALGLLSDDDMCLYQVLFEPVRHPWGEHTIRSVSNFGEVPIFVNAPELFDGAKQKIASPLYAAALRVVVRSGSEEQVSEILENVAGAFRVFEHQGGNSLIPVVGGEYAPEMQLHDALLRQTRRSGMILNADELINLVHFPSEEVWSPKLVRQDVTTRPAPASVVSHAGVLLGYNSHAGRKVAVSLNPEQRLRHTHIIGASGTGKSTLLYNMIEDDIRNGRGCAVLDPHGDLVDRILGIIPPERIKDVVLLDPSDVEFPVGFNILHAHSELEKALLASDLVSVFQRLSTSWGDQMGSVLSHAVLAFLESSRGGSLLDLRRFLIEPAFRNSFLDTVKDPEIVYYWKHGFQLLSGGKSIGPILTRLETFLTPKSIRYMVAQKENRLDFADILDTGKIFLAKLSQGAIGRENSYLLGTLLVSKFQQLAMARQGQMEKDRRDYILYVDEFPNFITPSMAEILSGARKYRLGLVLAHQELRQLERDREVASAVMSNTYSRICFRVGDSDAKSLEGGFSHFETRDLQNLGTGEAICRVEKSDHDFNLSVPFSPRSDDTESEGRRLAVIEASRARYAKPRAEVEAALLTAHAVVAREEPIKPEKAREMPPPAPIEPKVQNRVSPAPPPVIETLKPVVVVPPSTPGRGGQQHKYLQTFIKQWAEGMGWHTTIEAPVSGGSGSVDVLLSKNGVTIACEISVTTSVSHEIGNLKKCVAGGFTHIVSVCAEEKRAREIEAAAQEGIEPNSISRMRFLTPPQLFSFVEEVDAKNASTVTTVKGYKVKVNYRPLDAAEREAKAEQVASVIAKSLRRIRSKEGK